MTDERHISGPPASSGGPLRWGDKLRFQKLFSQQAVRAYLYLSLGMGLIAFLLPIALFIADPDGGHLSISHYYHGTDLARNLLVGCLWANGVFMFLFQGLSRWENWILNVGGAAAIGVAIFPTTEAQGCEGSFSFSMHFASAVTFFLCLAVVAIIFSKTRVRHIIYRPKRRLFKRAYDLAGLAMIAMPAAVAALYYLGGQRCESDWIFWIEASGIWAFAAYWFVKTAEYKTLLRIKWFATKRERSQMAKAREKKPS